MADSNYTERVHRRKEMTQHRKDDSARLAVLETSVETLSDDVTKLTRIVENIAGSVRELASKVESSGKTTTKEWMTMAASVGGFVLMAGAGLWSMGIAPIAQRQESNIQALRDVEQGVIRNSSNIARLVESLKEVETQFDAKYTIANLEHQNIERLIQTMWPHVHPDVPFPARTYWPQPTPARGPTLNGNH